MCVCVCKSDYILRGCCLPCLRLSLSFISGCPRLAGPQAPRGALSSAPTLPWDHWSCGRAPTCPALLESWGSELRPLCGNTLVLGHLPWLLPTFPQKTQTSAELARALQTLSTKFIPSTLRKDDPISVLQTRVNGLAKGPTVACSSDSFLPNRNIWTARRRHRGPTLHWAKDAFHKQPSNKN